MDERREEAEREVRRGNFQAALRIYETLLAERPGDERLSARVATLRENLQPMELTHPKAAAAADGPVQLSEAHLGEEAANRGDYPAAVQHYTRAVSAEPANALFRERLDELRAEAEARARLGDPSPELPPAAEPPPTSNAARAAVALDLEGTPAVASAPAPGGGDGWDLPADPVEALEALLARVRARRR